MPSVNDFYELTKKNMPKENIDLKALKGLLDLWESEPRKVQEVSYDFDPSILPENYKELLESNSGVKIIYAFCDYPLPFARVYGSVQDLINVFKEFKWIVNFRLPNYCGTLA